MINKELENWRGRIEESRRKKEKGMSGYLKIMYFIGFFSVILSLSMIIFDNVFLFLSGEFGVIIDMLYVLIFIFGISGMAYALSTQIIFKRKIPERV
jgi:hypothetical protein